MKPIDCASDTLPPEYYTTLGPSMGTLSQTSLPKETVGLCEVVNLGEDHEQ